MVTHAEDAQAVRARWLRRSVATAVVTAVIGIGGTGLAVAVLAGRQAVDAEPGSGGTSSASATDSASAGSTDSQSESGLGQAEQDQPAQGGSNGS